MKSFYDDKILADDRIGYVLNQVIRLLAV